MTNLQEAKLAREAEICYATMALVTDYDVWYEGEQDVTLETGTVERTAQRRDGAGHRPPRRAGARPAGRLRVSTRRSRSAINTPADLIPAATRTQLDLLIGKYVR